MPRFRADLKRFVGRLSCELLPQRLDLLLGVLKLPPVGLRRALGGGRLVWLPCLRHRDFRRDDGADVSRDRVLLRDVGLLLGDFLRRRFTLFFLVEFLFFLAFKILIVTTSR